MRAEGELRYIGSGTRTATTAPVRWLSRIAWAWTPVAGWAAAGVLLLSIGASVMVRWLAAGGVGLSVGDVSSLGAVRRVVLWGVQGIVVVCVAGIAVWAVRQYRREHRLTFDIALCLGFLSSFWLDPIVKFRHPGLLYDRALVHVPTWGPFIPWWSSPNADRQIESVLATGIGYLVPFGWFLVTAGVIRLIVLRRPQLLSRVRFPFVVLGVSVLLDIPFEMASILSGVYGYGAVFPALTLFSGQWYELPLYITFIMGLFWFAIPCLVRFRYAARGPESTILRGLGRFPAGLRPAVQTLAAIGLINTCTLAMYLTFWLISLIGTQTPAPPAPFPLV